MTDNPVAAANARTMWKRETPPTAAISSRVNASARWLSINQSAFWAGFMDDSLHSKLEHHDRFARASFDSPCSHFVVWKLEPDAMISAAPRKIPAKASLATSIQSCILRPHSIRRLIKLPTTKTARASASTSGRTMMHYRVLSHARSVGLAGLLAVAVAGAADAQKKYDPGATDTEIKIGNIMPYSGPASAYATIGKTEAAYFNKINADGGIHGRKINFISYDDAATPPKTVEQARKLVENDEVLLIFQSLGTAANTAIQKYMNAKGVPQLFVATGATKWNDPKHFPWTMGWQPNYQSEGHIFAQYLLKEHPSGKIGVIFQNDDYGKDYVKGLKDGLKGRMPIAAELPYELLAPTIDSQMVTLKGSGADIFFDVTIPKFAAQAIKKAAEIGWKPLHLLNSVSNSVGSTLKPAGLEISKGIISTIYLKDPTDPPWKQDPGYQEWLALLDDH